MSILVLCTGHITDTVKQTHINTSFHAQTFAAQDAPTLSLISLTMSKYGIPGLTIKKSAPSLTSLSLKQTQHQVTLGTVQHTHRHRHTGT